MKATLLISVVAFVFLAAGCRTGGRAFKFAPRPSPPEPAAASSAAAQVPAKAPVDETVASADVNPTEGLASALDDKRPPTVDPDLFKPTPRNTVQLWALPACDPAARPVDPNVYTRCSPRDAELLEMDERRILAAQGFAPHPTIGIDFQAGEPAHSRNTGQFRAVAEPPLGYSPVMSR